MGTKRNIFNSVLDVATELKDAGAVTASGAAMVGGSARVVNVGKAVLSAVLTVDFDALDIAGGDEAYEIRLQGSNDPTFATDVTICATLRAGKGTLTGEQDVGVGRRQTPFANIGEDGNPLQYLRAYHVIAAGAGTASVNYRAFISTNPLNGA